MRSVDEMRMLAMASEKRNDFLPDVPTLREEGFDIVSDIRRAFVAPKGVSKEVLDYLRGVFDKICKDPDYLADMKRAGQPTEDMEGEAFAAYVRGPNEIIKAALGRAGALKK
jgi:tripartite-type tricarboxylate transporter receptor subunit TctC